MNRDVVESVKVLEGQCAGASLCPLSQCKAGITVCIKRLATSPEWTDRLREMGLREEQFVRLLACESNYICQICNARLGISAALAEKILVEAVKLPPAGVPA